MAEEATYDPVAGVDDAPAATVVSVPADGDGAGDPQSGAFISYSRRDHAFVADLAARLAARGVPVWLDQKDIPAASRWGDELMRAIEDAGAFVFVISPDSIASEWCGRELAHATAANKRVIPVLYRSTGGVPPDLAARQFVPMADAQDGAALDQLVEAIRTDLEWIREHTHWLGRARDWERGGEDRGALLRGAELRAAENWLARAGAHEERPTQLQVRFVQASRRGSTRRLQFTLGAAGAAIAIAVGLAVFALIQRGQAIDRQHVAQSRALASAADAQLAVDPEVSVLLAAEGAEERRTAEAERAMRRAVASSFVRATFGGPSAFVESASSTPDGRYLAVGGDPNVTGLYDVLTGERVAQPHPGTARVVRVTVGPDGKTAVSASEDGVVRVWRIPSGEPIAQVRVPPGLTGGNVDSGASRMVTATLGERTARLWDVRAGTQVAVLPHADQVFAGRFSPDGDRIVTSSQDGTARIWSARDGRPLTVIENGAVVNRAAWSPDGRRVATADTDGFVATWDADTGDLDQAMSHEGGVSDVAYTPDGRQLVSGSSDATVRIWNATTGGAVGVMRGHTAEVGEVSVSGSGKTILSASQDGTARLWDLPSHTEVAVLRGHHDGVVSARFSDGGSAPVTIAQDGSAKVWRAPGERGTPLAGGAPVLAAAVATAADSAVAWSLAGGPSLSSLSSPPRHQALDAVGPVIGGAVDGRGDRFLFSRFEGGAVVVDAGSGAPIATIPDPGPAVQVALDGDGDTAAFRDADGIAVFDVRDGRRVQSIAVRSGLTLDGHIAVGGNIALSPDGTLVAAAEINKEARIWDVATGDLVARLPGHGSALNPSVTFSPDSRLAVANNLPSTLEAGATTTTSRISVVDARTGEVVSALPATLGEVTTTEFSPDGTRLVVSSRGDDDPVRIVDPSSGKAIVELRGNPAEVADAAFSPGGDLVATIDRAHAVAIWDATTGDLIERIRTGERPRRTRDTVTESIAWAPDGRRLVVVASTGAAEVVECRSCGDMDGLLAGVPDVVSPGRELTAEERAAFVPD